MPVPDADATTPLSLRATRAALRRLTALPDPALRALAGRPVVVDGERLRPEALLVQRFLDTMPGEPLERLPLGQAREEAAAEAWLLAGDTHVARVTETTVPGADGDLPARVYDARPGATPTGLLVWFHSGGHVLGDLDVDDAQCRLLARSSGLVVVSVAYRLAPEHPHPAGLLDAVAAVRALLDDASGVLDDSRAQGLPVVVGGQEAGGGLAAAVAQRVPGLAGQLLVTPWLDLDTRRPSHELFGERFTRTTAQLDWFRTHLLPDPALAVQASPGRADDLTGLPPALLVVLGFDPLRDEALDYAARLDAAGVPTTVIREPGLPHGALGATGTSRRAREVLDETGRALAVLVGAR